jgi:hypothetical protein
MSDADYCELCDLPRSQCVHGQPPPAPKPASRPASTRPVTRTSRTRVPATSGTPASRSKPVARRWTPPDVFKPLIVAVLQDAGGELDADELFLELEIRADEHLLPGDRETTPEGELRWRYAARRARQALVTEGLMVKGRPGVWELTAAGRSVAG